MRPRKPPSLRSPRPRRPRLPTTSPTRRTKRPDEQAEPEPRKFKVKVDGQDTEVTEDELLKGYSRTQDYTRKTQKVAEERKAVERRSSAQVRDERATVRAVPRSARESHRAGDARRTRLGQALRMKNPDEFAATWAAWDQHKKRQDSARHRGAARVETPSWPTSSRQTKQLETERERSSPKRFPRGAIPR
jgi:hypothetical protein